ncbi:MAG: FAD:protein FMN transferase [Aestuariivirga sp.]|uniref:FAD:protein FMN transferase n=1 Tax=Aestuariivirga sp. TaxID=2650926 RepID=UPI0038D1AC40
MSKTFIEGGLIRHALNGPTMGTRWTAVFHAERGFDAEPLRQALQAAVDEVDNQMSAWKPASDMNRLSAAPAGEWLEVPRHLLAVLRLGVEIGQASGGAFDIGLGDAVSAWGFGPDTASAARIRAARVARRRPAHELLEFGEGRVRKLARLVLDLNGIAKGYGVDRLSETLKHAGIASGLVGIDGEMRALGLRSDDTPWAIAVETPDPARRAAHAVLELEDAAVATSGDYRHWIEAGGRRLSHTMDPRRGAPLENSPASVTVVAERCAAADAWATALMVLGPERGAALAKQRGLDALFLVRDSRGGAEDLPLGKLFAAGGADAAGPECR